MKYEAQSSDIRFLQKKGTCDTGMKEMDMKVMQDVKYIGKQNNATHLSHRNQCNGEPSKEHHKVLVLLCCSWFTCIML